MDKDKTVELGQRIKDLRRKLRISQADFARKVEISKTTVCHYESGQRVPDSNLTAKICSEFKVNVEWLLTGKGEMFKPTTKTTTATGLAEKIQGDPVLNEIFQRLVKWPEVAKLMLFLLKEFEPKEINTGTIKNI